MRGNSSDELFFLQGEQGEIPDALAYVRGRSRPYTTKCSSTWHFADAAAHRHLGKSLPDLLRGVHLVEIGCGASPILDEFPNFNLASYTGIDINPSALVAAQAKPRVTSFPVSFALEDPARSLRARAPATIVSSALLEDSIIEDNRYGLELLAAIAASTPAGGYSVHVGMFEPYPSLLEKAGFVRVAGEYVYQKTLTAPGATLP